jgi:hypothetical protein
MATKGDEWFPARQLDGYMATKHGLMATWRPELPSQLASTATKATRELDGMMATEEDGLMAKGRHRIPPLGFTATKASRQLRRRKPDHGDDATEATRELDGMMATLTSRNPHIPVLGLTATKAARELGIGPNVHCFGKHCSRQLKEAGYVSPIPRKLKLRPDPRQLKVGKSVCNNCYPHWKKVMATETVMI